MEFRILGPLAVTTAGGDEIALPSPRQREVLLRLLLSSPEAVAADRLADDLFAGDDTTPGGSTVRTYVARLRTTLGPNVVVTRPRGYALDVGRDRVDAWRFEDLVREAGSLSSTDPSRAAELYHRAQALWVGDPLPEVADRAWAAATVSRLSEQRMAATEARIEVELRLGRHRELLPELAELTSAHPLREGLWVHRMRALYRDGRQAEALACYREVADTLREDLGIAPGPDLRAVHQAVLTQDDGLLASPSELPPDSTTVSASVPGGQPTVDDGPPTNLPSQRGRLYGRDAVLPVLASMVEEGGVLTLTGVGGVGKSRLSVEVAAASFASFPHGVWLVDLAALSDDAALDGAVAGVLGVPRREGQQLRAVLIGHLRRRRVLLVLDNCEHMAGAVAELVDDLTSSCPGVRVLATSREPLGAGEERIWVVTPLEVPGPDASPEQFAASDAVVLFARRAAAVSAGFEVHAGNAAVVARICRRLDGIPLAIELAAARMRMLTPEDLDARLDERFRLLTGGRRAVDRHRTLRNAIDWSHDLLDEDERVAFRRLAVFAGGFDLEAAGAVLQPSDEHQLVDLVGRLIDRSLLIVDRTLGRIRYRMLETIRQYALDRLEGEGELARVRDAHARHFLARAERAGALLRGPDEAHGNTELLDELDDLRVAFQWCLASARYEDAARIVLAIRWDRVDRQLEREATRWALQLLEESPVLPPDLDARVHAYGAMGGCLQGDERTAHRLALAALERTSTLDITTRLDVETAAVWVLWELGDLERAARAFLPLADPSIADGADTDVASIALAGIAIGMTEAGLAGSSESFELVMTLAERAVVDADRCDSPTARAMSRHSRGYALLDVDPPAAVRDFEVAAAVEGLAWPVWTLHARAHLVRLRVLAGDLDGMEAEVASILRAALATADELHLGLIAGQAAGALVVAGAPTLAAAASRLVRDSVVTPVPSGWRRHLLDLVEGVDEDLVAAADRETGALDVPGRVVWLLEQLDRHTG